MLRNLIFLGVTLLSSVCGKAQIKFYDVEEAFSISQRSEMPVLIFFTTQKCTNCTAIQNIMDSNKELQSFVQSYYIPTLVKESAATIPILDQYLVDVFPKIVVAKPNRDAVHTFTPVPNPDSLLLNLQNGADKFAAYLQFRIDLDTITSIESLMALALDYNKFNPSDNLAGIYNDAAKYNPTLKRLLFGNAPEILEYINLYSLFLDDPDVFIKNNRLRDIMVYAYYKRDKKVLNKKNTADLMSRFQQAGFTNLEETVAYMKIKEAELEIESLSRQELITPDSPLPEDIIKNFLLKYPHCPDKEMISKSLKHLMLYYVGKSFYQKLLETVQVKMNEYPEDFMLHDIRSVCLYFLGYTENAVKAVAKANELAYKAKYNYKPSLKVISKNK